MAEQQNRRFAEGSHRQAVVAVQPLCRLRIPGCAEVVMSWVLLVSSALGAPCTPQALLTCEGETHQVMLSAETAGELSDYQCLHSDPFDLPGPDQVWELETGDATLVQVLALSDGRTDLDVILMDEECSSDRCYNRWRNIGVFAVDARTRYVAVEAPSGEATEFNLRMECFYEWTDERDPMKAPGPCGGGSSWVLLLPLALVRRSRGLG